MNYIKQMLHPSRLQQRGEKFVSPHGLKCFSLGQKNSCSQSSFCDSILFLSSLFSESFFLQEVSLPYSALSVFSPCFSSLDSSNSSQQAFIFQPCVVQKALKSIYNSKSYRIILNENTQFKDKTSILESIIFHDLYLSWLHVIFVFI